MLSPLIVRLATKSRQLSISICGAISSLSTVQFVKCTVERGGTFKSIPCGISRSCSLSLVIAVYYLKDVDEQMAGDGRYFYRRYMDDIIVLVKTFYSTLKIDRFAEKTLVKHSENLSTAHFRSTSYLLTSTCTLAPLPIIISFKNGYII